MSDPLELERVWRWTGEQLTDDQKLRRIQAEAVRINTLAPVTLRSPEQDQRQGLVQLAISPLSLDRRAPSAKLGCRPNKKTSKEQQ
jgi:hypothetical protein